MFSFEGSGQRVIVGLGNDALSDPLPELSLGSPKLLPVLADHEGSLLLLFLLLVFGAYGFAHRCFCIPVSSFKFQVPGSKRKPADIGGRSGLNLWNRNLELETWNLKLKLLPDTRVSWYVFISDEMSTHVTPKGNLICEAALGFQSC